ncbi:MAG: AAA family ATPase [Bacteroidales bacterium]|jgi:predicted ATPase
MSLNYIYIDGFRNVKETKIEFNQITGLLSVNSYGKSNLLTAFEFGTLFLTDTPREKSMKMGYINGVPLTLSNLYKDFTFEIGLNLDIKNKQFEVIYGYSFKWSKPEEEGAIVKEYLRVRELGESQKFTLYIDRNDVDKALYKSSATGRCDKIISIEKNELIINKIMAYDNLFYLDIVKYLNSVSIYIDRHLDSSFSFTPNPIIFKGSNEFDLKKESDIARILFRLKSKHNDKYQLIINTVKDIFPFIIDIEVEEHTFGSEKIELNIDEEAPFELADKIYRLYAIHKNMKTKLSFNSMSDGVRRVLLLYTFTIVAQLNNILLIAIEEPENSINPGLFKKYLIGLDNFVEDSKIILTSHSPFLINYINPDNLYIGVPNQNYEATFRKFKQNSINKLTEQSRANSMMVGEYVFDLMNGTEEDFEELCRYLEND